MKLPLKWTVRAAWPAVLAATLLAGCSATDPLLPEQAAAHPLEGRIWDVRAGEFVDYSDLRADAAGAGHVLLGEIHINPEHHRIQARILGDLIADGRSLALVLEAFEGDRQEAIDAAVSDREVTTEDIAAATGIGETGWDWDGYEPLVQLALDHELPILAGNAPDPEAMQVAREGLSAVPDERRAALGLSVPLPDAGRAALTETIVASHCGHVAGDMAGRLVDAQRLRDATMADVMLGAAPGRTVLIAGAGHAQRDYGVPHYLLNRSPDVGVLSVGLTEVFSGHADPTAYVDRLAGLDVPFDYLWFTSRTVSEDPCEQFRKSLEKFHGAESDEAPEAAAPSD